ncbi:TadE/TadG family type IV pilus assembly protein [Yoonia sp. 208BN28-4]|uniref:TadE/TadG family type IV pilus assembly protein n=1 Tax=Yoonia sp. 208BN28-4 TaxID=3126505 RepID=UPI0030AE15CD
MSLTKSILARLRRLRRDESGSGTVEMVFMVPLLCWCLLSTISYFHAYRSEHVATKAATTLADMVSRETEYITPSYLNGMRGMLRFLTMSDTVPSYRLTVIMWNEDKNKYVVRWSRERGDKPTLRTSDLPDISNQLPLLKDQERAIIVETWTDYVPQYEYNLGLNEFEFESFIVTRPRFSTQLCFAPTAETDPVDAKC